MSLVGLYQPRDKPDWRKYKKIYLDNVTVWVGKDGQLSKVKPADRQRMADVMFMKFHEALSKVYEITTQHGPDTMWFQIAITEADSSMPVLDTISSLIPQARMLSDMKSVATGVSAFTLLGREGPLPLMPAPERYELH